MNHPNISSVVVFFKRCLTVLIGSVHWTSPGWVKSLRQKIHQHPSQALGIVLGLCVAFYVYDWYQRLPAPVMITAMITAPKPTVIANPLIPEPVIVNFGIQDREWRSQAVAPINLVGKSVPKGITLTPQHAGEWRWVSDSQLVFTPDKDWPAEEKYTITLADDAISPQVKMATHVFTFSTQSFQAKIKDFKFYQDPITPTIHQAIATVEFNFPVDTTSFTTFTDLVMDALTEGGSTFNKASFKFTVKFDQYKRLAYIHSETISLSDTARNLQLNIGEGVHAASQPRAKNTPVSLNLLIPDKRNFFKVAAVNAAIVRNPNDKPEQVLSIETTLGIKDTEINRYLQVFLLPQNYPATATTPEKENYNWQVPGEVSDAILKLSQPVLLQSIPANNDYATLHSYILKADASRFIYVRLNKGAQSLGDFSLSDDYKTILPVPVYPKEIGFIHKGALLALGGEKKLSVTVRGLPAVKFSLARLLPDNVNQLVTQTQGDFNNPYFINASFNQQNISEVYSEIRQFDTSDLSKQLYTAIDFTQHLSNKSTVNGGPQGLFLLQAVGWNPVTQEKIDVNAQRLVLITDLSLVVKNNQDGSHDVLVESITQGLPVANAKVAILGKNGLPILTETSDADGRVHFPTLVDYIEEQEPTAYLASLDSDVSFIPYSNFGRSLNFSRFDVGGIYTRTDEAQQLSAYLFSERGIYRPGDTTHIAMIVKQAFAKAQPAGLPLALVITDPRGTTVFDKQLLLDDSGYMNIDFHTSASSPTGQYYANLYLVKDNHAQSMLGSTQFRVAEFEPDRMRISAELSSPAKLGWVSPDALTVAVSLSNLYGTPAVDRKISSKLLLSPQAVKFEAYPDYQFVDPLYDAKKPAKVFTETLEDTSTDAKGQASIALNLDRFDKATYQLTLFTEGFEAEGGRSVTTQTNALVSPLPYFVGFKADGDLSYVKHNSQRQVEFIAINPELKQQSVEGLTIELLAVQPVSTLVHNPDGTYQYQTITQSTLIHSHPFTVNSTGTVYPLDTTQVGDFAIRLVDSQHHELSQFNYTVTGTSQVSMTKNAELTVKLDQAEYQAGTDITLQITAPYTGTGLITIERDKVYALAWFKTDSFSSIQHIHIPEDMQGDGYVNVTFVRDWNSPDIFVSPLSYSVMPFNISHEAQNIHLALTTPKLTHPGEPLTIEYVSDKPARVIIFAVDEGILQLTRFETPNPLAYFFQKHALEVETRQTIDEILPKFIQERELSAVGGDDGSALLASHLNPFKRKTDLPVVYWSGIIDADTMPRQVSYNVPDYFNGNLRIMAVAVGENALGAATKNSLVRGDFVINPNTPTFVAPGDTFDTSVSVANNVVGSGKQASITITAQYPAALTLLTPNTQTITIAEGEEKTVHFKWRANEILGSSEMTFRASTAGKSSVIKSTLSIRPASPYLTSVTSGQGTGAVNLLLDKTLYPEYRKREASLSASPLLLVSGLAQYLDNYPYGCTEQVTSKAWPLLAMSGQPWFNQDSAIIHEKIAGLMQTLTERQLSSGAFAYWPNAGANENNAFDSVYALHFLTDAREFGINIPSTLLTNGLTYLKDLVSQPTKDNDMARLQSYAIYVLTRNEIVTTNYLTSLQRYLNDQKSWTWQTDIVGAYIAASYQLLQRTSDAEQLIEQYKQADSSHVNSDFYTVNMANAEYLYLLAKHFPKHLEKVGDSLVMKVVQALNHEELSTILSGYSSAALLAYEKSATLFKHNKVDLSITEDFSNKTHQKHRMDANQTLILPILADVKSLTLNNTENSPYFYQVTQTGFDKSLSDKAVSHGIEIYREYQDATGAIVTQASLGQEVEVHIQVRALDNQSISNVAIVDLLPGGFDVVRESVKQEQVEYVDVREDRVVYFTSVGSDTLTLVYRIKAVNMGLYQVPYCSVSSMYHPEINARTGTSSIEVRSI